MFIWAAGTVKFIIGKFYHQLPNNDGAKQRTLGKRVCHQKPRTGKLDTGRTQDLT